MAFDGSDPGTRDNIIKLMSNRGMCQPARLCISRQAVIYEINIGCGHHSHENLAFEKDYVPEKFYFYLHSALE